MMTNMTSQPASETVTLSLSTSSTAHEKFDSLALELAQTLKPAPGSDRGKPVQSQLKGLEEIGRASCRERV